jgi:nitroreductase
MPELGAFMRHRSVRKYRDDPIPEETIKGLVACAQGAATSSNLQLYSLISVQDPGRREEIAKRCDNYEHIKTCSWFFGFFADHYRLKHLAAKVGEKAEGLGYVEFYTMAVIDAALAAERMVCAAEALGIGICYIGALRNDAQFIKENFGLPEGLFGVFGLCLGWPEEGSTAEIKPRLRQEAIWFREKYDLDPPTEEYDERMKSFHLSQGMNAGVTWSMRSGRRVDRDHLTGREVLKGWLEGQGFNLE